MKQVNIRRYWFKLDEIIKTDVLPKYNKIFDIIIARKKFIIFLAFFIIIASIIIKTTYLYLSNILPKDHGVILVKFKPNELIENFETRLSYLASRVKGIRFKLYKVKMGDNLWKISRRHGYSVHTIIGCNPQLETYEVDVNQKLVLPTKAGTLHVIQKNDTFQKISERYDVSIDKIRKINYGVKELIPCEMVFIPDKWPAIDLMNNKMRHKYELRSLFVSPLGGRLTSVFGSRRHPVTKKHSFHGGVDIAVKPGTWVGAAADGVVILAASGMGHYGKAVYIDHKNGYVTHYGHLSKIYVKKGQKVKSHQLIAKSGSTGRVTGPHLHFTIKRNDKYIDPLKFLW